MPLALSVVALRAYFIEWKSSPDPKTVGFHDFFDNDQFEQWRDENPIQIPSAEPQNNSFTAPAESVTTVKATTPAKVTLATVINASVKVDAKDLPKLPTNKTIEGPVFDKFKTIFEIKMMQPNVLKVIQMKQGDGGKATFKYPVPATTATDYGSWDQADSYVLSALTTAILNTNAWECYKPHQEPKMTGRQLYKALCSRYKGEGHQTNDVLDAQEDMNQMTFGTHSRDEPEYFLAKFNSYLLRQEDGGEPYAPALIVPKFLETITHPGYDAWKETVRELDWEEMKTKFI